MLNSSLRAVGPWALRAGLLVWLMNVEDPFRLAGAVLVLAAQVPLPRQVLAWGFARVPSANDPGAGAGARR